MNILFISKLSGNLWAGPNNSVPAQIRAQAKVDNVLWFNYNHAKRTEWIENGLNCKNLDDIPSGRLSDFPTPFNKPDMVVVEEVYCFPFCRLIADVQKSGIPYVVVPRSQLTTLAQKNKPLKKIIGNVLYFNRFVKKAHAVQYLTEKEKSESGSRWNENAVVIPNGIQPPVKTKKAFSQDHINAVYIGRIDIYQKGLDILLKSIACLKSQLEEKKFVLTLYGPDRNNSLNTLKNLAKLNGLEDFVKFEGCVFGEEKRNVLLNTDVFVMTSRFEGLPMGMIEALSFGIPCLATNGTNLASEIEQFNAGWTADNTIESVKEALDKVVHEKDFALIGRNSLALSKAFYWDCIANRSHLIYADILGKE